MRISDWSSDVCSSDLIGFRRGDKRRDLQQDDFMIAGRILRMTRAFEGEGRIADEDGARTRTASIDPLPSVALVLVSELTPKGARTCGQDRDADHAGPAKWRHGGRLALHGKRDRR